MPSSIFVQPGQNFQSISIGGSPAVSASAPTFTSGFGGATGRSITGNSFAFTIVCGNNGTDDNGVLAMPFTATNGWVVFVVNQTTANQGGVLAGTAIQTAGTTSSVTIHNYDVTGGNLAFANGNVLKCIAVAY